MPNFSRNDVLTFPLAQNKSLLVTGTVKFSITPSGGTTQQGTVTGINQPLGPFNSSTTITLTCDTSGSYSVLDVALNSSQQYVQQQITNLNATYNINNATYTNNLMRARAAFAKVRAGTANAKVAVISNSLGAGTGANSGSSVNQVAFNYPSLIQKRLLAKGLSVGREVVVGDNNISTLTYDSRLSFGTNWGLGGGYSAGLGGNAINKSFDAGAGASPLVFTPSKQCDTYEGWFIQDSSRGSFTTNATGTLASVNLNGAQAFVRYTGTVTLGTALTITPVGTNQLNPVILWGYNSAIKEVSIFNCSAGGKTANYFAQNSSPVTPIQQLQVLAPNLTIIDNCVNDWSNSTAIASFMADTQILITAALVSGDVILATQVPSRIDVAPLATQQMYVDALYQLAISNNIPLIDTFGRMISYETGNPSPMQFYYDNKHMTDAGYQDITSPYVDLFSKII